MSTRHKNPRRFVPGARWLALLPKDVRAKHADIEGRECAVVYLPKVCQHMPDRGGAQAAAGLPELDEHYRDGFAFVHADPVDQGESLEVYLVREVMP